MQNDLPQQSHSEVFSTFLETTKTEFAGYPSFLEDQLHASLDELLLHAQRPLPGEEDKRGSPSSYTGASVAARSGNGVEDSNVRLHSDVVEELLQYLSSQKRLQEEEEGQLMGDAGSNDRPGNESELEELSEELRLIELENSELLMAYLSALSSSSSKFSHDTSDSRETNTKSKAQSVRQEMENFSIQEWVRGPLSLLRAGDSSVPLYVTNEVLQADVAVQTDPNEPLFPVRYPVNEELRAQVETSGLLQDTFRVMLTHSPGSPYCHETTEFIYPRGPRHPEMSLKLPPSEWSYICSASGLRISEGIIYQGTIFVSHQSVFFEDEVKEGVPKCAFFMMLEDITEMKLGVVPSLGNVGYRPPPISSVGLVDPPLSTEMIATGKNELNSGFYKALYVTGTFRYEDRGMVHRGMSHFSTFVGFNGEEFSELISSFQLVLLNSPSIRNNRFGCRNMFEPFVLSKYRADQNSTTAIAATSRVTPPTGAAAAGNTRRQKDEPEDDSLFLFPRASYDDVVKEARIRTEKAQASGEWERRRKGKDFAWIAEEEHKTGTGRTYISDLSSPELFFVSDADISADEFSIMHNFSFEETQICKRAHMHPIAFASMMHAINDPSRNWFSFAEILAALPNPRMVQSDQYTSMMSSSSLTEEEIERIVMNTLARNLIRGRMILSWLTRRRVLVPVYFIEILP